MGFRINTNTLSLMAQRNLSKTTKAFAKSLERLSSGSRINRAGDDAAGLAIGTGIEAQLRAISRGIQNLNDAKGFLETAEGAMAEQTNIIQRMRELALQAANGTIGDTERGFLDEEFQSLLDEFDRIVDQTDFNGTKLLDGSFKNLDIQIGQDRGDSIELSLNSSKMSEVIDVRETVVPGTFSESTLLDLNAQIRINNPHLADFNNDGNLDYLSGHFGSMSVSLGDGEGGFGDLDAYGAGSAGDLNPTIGDINNDGNLDVVGGSRTDVVIFIGNGDGTFEASTTFNFDSVDAVVTGLEDLNGDGNLDLVVTGGASDMVGFYLGNGDGSFAFQNTMSTGSAPRHIDIADFNGDEVLDVIVTHRYEGGSSVFLGNGDGTFAVGITQSGSFWVNDLLIEDFNGDGIEDIARSFANPGTQGFEVFLGKGDGTFSANGTVDFSGYSPYIDALDADDDGDLDLVVSFNDSRDAQVFLSNGDGSFYEGEIVGPYYGRVRVGDIDNDGQEDIIISDAGTNNEFAQSLLLDVENQTRPISYSELVISEQASAQDVLEYLDTALASLATRRANIGAQLNRLEFAASNASITRENLANARSQIMDADIAEETAELTRQQVLQQAGVAVLGQANTSQQLALQLLGNIG